MKQDVFLSFNRYYSERSEKYVEVFETFEEALEDYKRLEYWSDGILQIGPNGRKYYSRRDLEKIVYEQESKKAELVEIKIIVEEDDDEVIIGHLDDLPIVLKESYSGMFSRYECECVLAFFDDEIIAYVPREKYKKYLRNPKLLKGKPVIGAMEDDDVPFSDKRFSFV